MSWKLDTELLHASRAREQINLPIVPQIHSISWSCSRWRQQWLYCPSHVRRGMGAVVVLLTTRGCMYLTTGGFRLWDAPPPVHTKRPCHETCSSQRTILRRQPLEVFHTWKLWNWRRVRENCSEQLQMSEISHFSSVSCSVHCQELTSSNNNNNVWHWSKI